MQSHKNVIELPQPVQPVFEPRNFRRPHLIHPTNARLAFVLPSLYGIHVEKVPVVWADSDKQVIFASQPDGLEPGIQTNQTLRNIVIQEPSLQGLPRGK